MTQDSELFAHLLAERGSKIPEADQDTGVEVDGWYSGRALCEDALRHGRGSSVMHQNPDGWVEVRPKHHPKKPRTLDMSVGRGPHGEFRFTRGVETGQDGRTERSFIFPSSPERYCREGLHTQIYQGTEPKADHSITDQQAVDAIIESLRDDLDGATYHKVN